MSDFKIHRDPRTDDVHFRGHISREELSKLPIGPNGRALLSDIDLTDTPSAILAILRQVYLLLEHEQEQKPWPSM